MMKVGVIVLVSVLFCTFPRASFAQNLAVKTNALCWASLAPNAGVEAALGRNLTLEVAGAYKPWTVRAHTNVRFWLLRPEFRYWLCEAFEGHFFGVHLHAAQYYAHRRQRIYDGYLAGAGITYGYDWMLAPRWNLEALIGVGYARLWYKDRPDLRCTKCAADRTRNYVGPTRIALSISYLF